MQKIYSRINWENDPSTNTAINEDNLNRMDSAIDTLDDRVVQLAGYQKRVEQSEQNAKESEVNAKQSESKASTHELNAKSYMESAKASEEVAKEKANFVMASTPEGYDELVATVGRMDIQTSTDTALYNTKPGGYRLLEMTGATVQNGEQTPSTPIAIENTFDCVEMVNGYVDTSSNSLVNAIDIISNKRLLPCKSGDKLKVITEKECAIKFFFYKDGAYVRSHADSESGVNEFEATVPSEANQFYYRVIGTSAITPQTVGKITLTVNGKYVGQIVEHGKNFFSYDETKVTLVKSSARTTYLYPKNIPLYLDAGVYYITMHDFNISNNKYPLSIKFNGSDAISVRVVYEDSSLICYEFTLTESELLTHLYCYLTNSDNDSATATFSQIMIVKADDVDLDTLTYEPYTEKVTTFFLNEPLRATDRVVKVDGVYMENHKKGSMVFDGTTEGSWYKGPEECQTENSNMFYLSFSKKSIGSLLLCSHFTYGNAFNGDTECIEINPKNNYIYIRIAKQMSASEFKVWLSENPITVEYELAEETYTPLDTASQLALNDMVTFDGVTYIEVDSKIPPTSISGEYGTSQVGAYTLKCMNDNDTDRVEREELKAQLDELAIALISQ